MAFNPDEYLKSTEPKQSLASGGFDPDAYLAATPAQPAEPTKDDRSKMRTAADWGLSFQSGATGVARAVASSVPGFTGSKLDKGMKDAMEHLEGLKSAVAKKDSAEVARIFEDAKDKGVLEGVVAGAKAFSVAPGQTLFSAAGSMVPLAATAALGTPVAVIAGLAAGAGSTKSGIYETIKEELTKEGKLPPEEIERRAQAAQDYIGKNSGQIALGAGLGALENITGIQGALLRGAARRSAKEMVEAKTKEIAEKGLTRTVGGGFAKEFVPESLQGGHEQFAQNVALQKEGFDVPTMRGVVAKGTMEGIAGGLLGGPMSMVERAQARAALNSDTNRIGELQDRIDAEGVKPGSTEEKVLTLASQLQAQGMSEEEAIRKAAETIKAQQSATTQGATPSTAPVRQFEFNTYDEAQKRVNLLRRARPKEDFFIMESDDGKFEVYAQPKKEGTDASTQQTDAATAGTDATVPSGQRLDTPAGGSTQTKPSGVVDTTQPAGQPDAGTEEQYSTLEETPTEEAPAVETALPSLEALQAQESALTTEIDRLKEKHMSMLNSRGHRPRTGTEKRKLYDALIDQELAFREQRREVDSQIQQLKKAEATPVEEVLEGTQENATPQATEVITGDETSGTETAEAQQTETQGTEPTEEAFVPRPDADTATAADDLAEAIQAMEEHLADQENKAAERAPGMAVPAGDKRKKREVDEALFASVAGKSGMISSINKLTQRIRAIETIMDVYGRYNYDPNIMIQADITQDDIAEMELIIPELRAQRKEALKNLAEFEVNPRYQDHPARQKAFEYLDKLPKKEGLEIYRSVLDKETKLQSEEEAKAEQESRTKREEAAKNVTVTTKKPKRKVVIPAIQTPGRTSQSRKQRRSMATSTQTDPAFEAMSSVPGGVTRTLPTVLRYVQRIGNAFEQALATRLLAPDNYGSVKNTTFYVLNPVDDEMLDALGEDFDNALGLYVLDDKGDYVFLRGDGFGSGPDENGVNNQTFLHEALHATVNKRVIYAAHARELGLDIDPELEATVVKLHNLMEKSRGVMQDILKDLDDKGIDTPPELQRLIYGGAFNDVTEFVTYGMTDKDMQAFLLNRVEGKEDGLSAFINLIMNLVGLGPEHRSGLRDLITYTDRIAASIEVSPQTADRILTDMEYLDAGATSPKRASAQSKVSKTGTQVKKESKGGPKEKAPVKLQTPLAHPDKTLGVIGQLTKDLSLKNLKAVVSDVSSAAGSATRQNLGLGGLSTRQLVDSVTLNNIEGVRPILDKVLTLVDKATAKSYRLMEDGNKLAQEWSDWQKNWFSKHAYESRKPGQISKRNALNDLMHLSTVNKIDPSVSPGKSKVLDELYNTLDDKGKELYQKVRDFHKQRFLDYKAQMVERIKNSGMDEASVAKAIAQIDEDYKATPEPYFPLMREGKYWMRVGDAKDPNTEYYMFESAQERNFFARQRAEELGKDAKITKGDGYRQLADESMKNNAAFKKILDIVENSSGKDKDAIKDELAQMYLTTLPEGSFRKKFIHRKGTAGYRSDALRNFTKANVNTASLLSKTEFGHQMRLTLSRATDITKEMPEYGTKVKPFLDEISERVDHYMSPAFEDKAWFADLMGKTSFTYYLSSPASALVNMTGLAIFGGPVLNAEFGLKANAALANNMKVYKTVGITGPKGEFTAPTLFSALKGHRKQAYLEALARGKIDSSQTMDAVNFRDKLTGDDSKFMAATSYLFRQSERLTREVMFMTAYDLAHAEAQAKKMSPTDAYNYAVDKASMLTDEALFDYSRFNKPRWMRSGTARVITQFKTYAQMSTMFLYKNLMTMFKGATPKQRSVARTKFLGVLGMTYIFSGVTGLPLFSVIAWAMSKIAEDDEDPEKRNAKLRFSNWLRESLGVGAGLTVEKGPVSTMTGADFASRTKLDQLWIRETKPNGTDAEMMQNIIMQFLGPNVGLAINAGKLSDALRDGDMKKVVELALPAGIRGFANAYNQSKEGVKNPKGDQIISADEISTYDTVVTAIGLAPTKVAVTKEDTRRVNEVLDKIKLDRQDVLSVFKDSIADMSDEDKRLMAMEALKKFNRLNPNYAIEADEVISAIESNIEASAKSIRGIRVKDEMRPVAERLRPPSPLGK